MDLLADLLVRAPQRRAGERWESSGLHALTGFPDRPPLDAPAAIADRLADVAATVHALGGPCVDGPALAAERAQLQGLTRGGRTSCGGACELVPTLDGWVAVNLPRPSDRELLPAWLGDDTTDWKSLVARTPTAVLVERAIPLGLPVAAPGECATRPRIRRPLPFSVQPPAPGAAPYTENGFRVVDLTAMWAGPLCARLLGMAGAEVVKVEDPRRPDAARHGSPELFRRLHDGHRLVQAPIASVEVRDLVLGADVVLESARPRALPQAGLDREAIAAETGCVWVSITGHGLDGGERAAFGDDAAVAGGLVGWDLDGPVFCGDALADPVTGLLAAVGALEGLRRGGPWIVDAGLAPCAAELARAR
jgi:hypothetical protein